MGGIVNSVFQWFCMLSLPDGAPQALRAACRALFPLAGLLTAIVIAGGLLMPARAFYGALITWAVAVSALISCWAIAVGSADGRRELTLLCADLYRRIPEADRPDALRAASGH